MNSRYIVIFVAITTITTIGAYTYNEAMASHAFEGGTAGGALPIATTVIISGEVMQSGDCMPLVDFSPNFVAGHLLHVMHKEFPVCFQLQGTLMKRLMLVGMSHILMM